MHCCASQKFTTKKNKTVRNQITPRKIPQVTPKINKINKKIKKERNKKQQRTN
jgi:membrane protein insertase Oxa1/YidC/SpoIIIJ